MPIIKYYIRQKEMFVYATWNQYLWWWYIFIRLKRSSLFYLSCMTKKWVKIKIGIQDTYNTGINNINDSIYCLSCLFTNFSNNFGITCSLCLLVDGHYLHVRINHISPITHCTCIFLFFHSTIFSFQYIP